MTSRTTRAGSSAPGSKTGAKLILSVDDEPWILYTRQLLLESVGYEVPSAANGDDALRMFADNAVDLVLLDYVMPGLDGGVVAQEIKRRSKRVPVILVSASPVPEDILLLADYFITKGQGPGLLLEKIDQLLAAISRQQSA